MGGHDVLSKLVQIHDDDVGRLNDDELIGQTNFLFMAGHATTACALTWTLFLLAQHPCALRQVAGELEDKCGGGVPARDQLDDLPFLDAVIKESLRLLPPVLWWSRVSTAAFALGPYELPSGTRLVHSAYITHRDAERFPEPDRFVPARWFETAPGPLVRHSPAGPRMCPGAPFALMELKRVPVIIPQRWRRRCLTVRSRSSAHAGRAQTGTANPHRAVATRHGTSEGRRQYPEHRRSALDIRSIVSS